ncbi:MAG: hypothetical protein JWP32_971 [Schumannella sp.]|nr:hypothetical protein [Schumannella sp.]
MVDDSERKRGYPYMSVNVWAELRRAFVKNVPNTVTSTWLQSVFKSSAKAASNLLPQLKTVGLIDSDGVPQDLAKRYRVDKEYQSSVAEILDRVYPEEVRGLYPGPTEDVQDVANWFMLDTGGGQIGATSQAKFYLMLVSGELPTAEARVPRSTKPAESIKAKQPKVKAPEADKNTSAGNDGNLAGNQGGLVLGGGGGEGPALHLDIQVHIDAAASAEQIDAVFASMAKHIYKK